MSYTELDPHSVSHISVTSTLLGKHLAVVPSPGISAMGEFFDRGLVTVEVASQSTSDPIQIISVIGR
jgi:hypothetical protein